MIEKKTRAQLVSFMAEFAKDARGNDRDFALKCSTASGQHRWFSLAAEKYSWMLLVRDAHKLAIDTYGPRR